MATKSIHTVDVDDAAFQRFNSLFQQYAKQLKALPGAWQGTNKETRKAAAHYADMTAALMAQKKLLKEQSDEVNKRTKAEREAAKVERQRRAEQEKMVKTTKAIAGNIASATMNLLKWAGIGGVISGLLGAGGFFGLDRLASGVGAARMNAQGLGMTAGQQGAFNINFSRFFDTGSVLSNIANSKSDYARRAYFSMMGINPNGKDNGQLGMDLAFRAKKMFDAGDGSEQYAQARGLLNFFTMEDLRRLHATSWKELRGARGGYGSDLGSLTIGDAAQRRWQDFSVQLERASAQIKLAFVDALTPVIPALTDLSKAAVKTIGAFLSNPKLKEWVADFGRTIQHWAEVLGSEKFQTDVRSFVTNFALVCQKLVDGLKWLGVIPDNGPGLANGGAVVGADGAGQVSGAKNYYSSDKNKNNWETSVAQFFEKQGWSREASAALSANLWAEGHNPLAWGDYNKKTKRYDAYGIGQWHRSRQLEFKKLFGHEMWETKDPARAMAEQLQFVDYELKRGQYQNVGRALREKGHTAGEMGAVVSEFYESPKDRAGERTRRGADATVVITIMNQTGAHVSVQGAQLPR